jgi:hypothetical protein
MALLEVRLETVFVPILQRCNSYLVGGEAIIVFPTTTCNNQKIECILQLF